MPYCPERNGSSCIDANSCDDGDTCLYPPTGSKYNDLIPIEQFIKKESKDKESL